MWWLALRNGYLGSYRIRYDLNLQDSSLSASLLLPSVSQSFVSSQEFSFILPCFTFLMPYPSSVHPRSGNKKIRKAQSWACIENIFLLLSTSKYQGKFRPIWSLIFLPMSIPGHSFCVFGGRLYKLSSLLRFAAALGNVIKAGMISSSSHWIQYIKQCWI